MDIEIQVKSHVVDHSIFAVQETLEQLGFDYEYQETLKGSNPLVKIVKFVGVQEVVQLEKVE